MLYAWTMLAAIPAHAGELVLGMSAAFSGPSRALGIELYRGSMAYLEEVNRAGGVYGNTLVLKAYDDAYDPTQAIRNTIRLIEQDHAFLLFDYVGTPTVTRVLPLIRHYSRDNLFLFFPYTGAQPQRRPPYDEFVFNLRASYQDETDGLVDEFIRAGKTRIAVFYQADAYGRGGWEGVRNALRRHGLDIAAEATYRRGHTFAASLASQVDILRSADPEAVIAVCSYAACAAFIRDARQAGFDIPIANLSFAGSEAMAGLLIEAGKADGADYTRDLITTQVVPSYQDLSLPAVAEYRRLMDALGPRLPDAAEADTAGGTYRPLAYSFASLEGYLNARLLVRILREMGPDPQRSRIRETVESLAGVDLGTGDLVSFGPSDHQGSDRVYFTLLRDGEFLPLPGGQPQGLPE